MTFALYLEQTLNGLQVGIMLFLMAAGLTLVFGIMNFINLAHGSLYMIGAFCGATAIRLTGSFPVAVLAGVAGAALVGLLVELIAARRLYHRDHLDQVLGTFGLLLFFNEMARIVWGASPLYMSIPEALQGFVEIVPGSAYPTYRIAIMATGLIVAVSLFLVVTRTKLGMHIRAGASNREILGALGIDVTRLFALVFALGAALAGLAGVMMGPLLSVEVGMGEPILILAFVVIVIGGLGSIRGAFVGALLVGFVDTFGRFLLPEIFGFTVGPALSSMAIYMLMVGTLAFRPCGLFPAPVAASGAGETPAAIHGAVDSPRLRIILPVVALLLALVPVLNEPYYTRLATRIMIFGIAALSLDIIFGYGGLVSFGHAAFLGMGAYVVGILAFHGIDSALIAWPAAVAAAALAAVVIGSISLRTSGFFFIMITLAFGQLLYFLGVGLAAYGGDDGLPLRAHTKIPAIGSLSDSNTIYYVSFAALIVSLFVARRFVGSEFGLVLRGIRDNERRMRALGHHAFWRKLTAFAFAGGLCGFAGALLVNVDSFVSPSTLHWFQSGELMIMVILGGAASLFGPVFGAGIYMVLEELLSDLTQHWHAIFGPLLLAIVLFTRGGLFNWLFSRRRHGR